MSVQNKRNIDVSLSLGSLSKILDGEDVVNPILQILGYKPIPGSSETNVKRYRLLLYDGKKNISSVILAKPLNNLILSKQLEKYTVFKLKEYALKGNTDLKMIVCTSIEPLIPGSAVNGIIEPQGTVSNETNGLTRACDAADNNNSKSFEASSPLKKFKFDRSILPSTSNEISPPKQNENSSPRSKGIFLTAFSPESPLKRLKTHHDRHFTSTTTDRLITPPKSNNQSTISTSSVTTSLNFDQLPTQSNFMSRTAKEHLATPPKLPSKDNESIIGTQNSCSPTKNPVIPIAHLAPFFNKWTLLARVTYKTPMFTYKNEKGSGKFFLFYILDDSGELKISVFNNEADVFYSNIQIDKVYYIWNASIKESKQNAFGTNYELTLNDKSNIQEFTGVDTSIPQLKFNFVPIRDIITRPIDSYVDIIAVCRNHPETRTLIGKNGNPLIKLELQLCDRNNDAITLTFWGSDAEHNSFNKTSIVALRNARISSFNGCSLVFTNSSMVFIEPDIPEAAELKSWFESINLSQEYMAFPAPTQGRFQSWKTLGDIHSEITENAHREEYFNVKATIVTINKEKCMYQACPAQGCFKKVVQTPSGLYECKKCNKEYDEFIWIYMLLLELGDFTGLLSAKAFQDVATRLVGISATELNILKERDFDDYQKKLDDLHFKSFIFKLRSKMEYFNETSRVGSTVMDASPVDFVDYTKNLLCNIERMSSVL